MRNEKKGGKAVSKRVYMAPLGELARLMDGVKNTPYTMRAKVAALTAMNMRYEKVAFDPSLRAHPYALTRSIVLDAKRQFENAMGAAFIEGADKSVHSRKSPAKEKKHRDLFNEIWDRYDSADYERYIRRYEKRARVNRLQRFVRGKNCVDLGCGNGNFLFALLRLGCAGVTGVDFGERSVAYAACYARKNKLEKKARFICATVYDTGLKPESFDFAIQNGVFHHLDDEDRAIREARRILRPGGWFWYYTDGEGGISYDLWDASVRMLRAVPSSFVESVLISMNVGRDKTAHIMDGLSATYAHTSWSKMTRRLAKLGFGDFRRMVGGFPTDCDHDRIAADPYGRAKFGEGDLRILCRRN